MLLFVSFSFLYVLEPPKVRRIVMRSDDTPDLLHVQNETRKGWKQGTSDQQDFDRSIGVKRVYF